jgi:chorismate mutase
MKPLLGYLDPASEWQYSIHPAVLQEGDRLHVPMLTEQPELSHETFDELVRDGQAVRLDKTTRAYLSIGAISESSKPLAIVHFGKNLQELLGDCVKSVPLPYFPHAKDSVRHKGSQLAVVVAEDAYVMREWFAKEIALRALEMKNLKLAQIAWGIDSKSEFVTGLLWEFLKGRQSQEMKKRLVIMFSERHSIDKAVAKSKLEALSAIFRALKNARFEEQTREFKEVGEGLRKMISMTAAAS